MVQQLYHEGVDNTPQWPAQYCWPEGFMRRFHSLSFRDHQILVTPRLVQIRGGTADNFITEIRIGRDFDRSGVLPRLGADVPRWYGETIGFWDGDVLISWTSNIQGWTVHGAFEFSNKLQTIEIYTPVRNADHHVVGINHEAILYDPEALVEPVRIVRNLVRVSDVEKGDPLTFIECTQSYFSINGVAEPKSPGDVIPFQVPDFYDRPWAEIWEQYHEDGMSVPTKGDVFSFE